MKNGLFIDTWGWVTLLNKRESRYKEIRSFYSDFRNKESSIYTTDYVLDETFTLLFRRLPFPIAAKAMSFIEDAIHDGYLLLEWITPERFKQAEALRLRFKDKPKISFTDLTTIVVMKELTLIHILTEDDHFDQIGMDFKILK